MPGTVFARSVNQFTCCPPTYMWYGIDQIATLSQQLLWAVGLQITFIVLNLILSAKFVQHLRNPWTTAKFQSAHAAGLGSFQPSTDPVSACGSMQQLARAVGRSVGAFLTLSLSLRHDLVLLRSRIATTAAARLSQLEKQFSKRSIYRQRLICHILR